MILSLIIPVNISKPNRQKKNTGLALFVFNFEPIGRLQKSTLLKKILNSIFCGFFKKIVLCFLYTL